MSSAVDDIAIAEAGIAFIRYVDAETGTGKKAAQIWQDAFILGYRAALTPRTILKIEADAASLLASESGVLPCEPLTPSLSPASQSLANVSQKPPRRIPHF